MSDENLTPQEQLSKLFGSYKAEWLEEQMFDLFAEPAYLPELATARPCVLLGGRGTGKTTVLRSLSYEGQFALRKRNVADIPSWRFYGFYYRVNTSRVLAFKGPELTEDRWVKVFAHYINLVLCDLVLEFLQWHQENCPHLPRLNKGVCSRVATSLHLEAATNVDELAENISQSLLEFESYVNNIGDQQSVPLSIQGLPIDTLLIGIRKLDHFKSKLFFFLLDEYENLQDYQQQVLNTAIKHSGGDKHPYTFKVGVKELGWRYRATLNPNEQLISPADYVRINISEKLQGDRFRTFALRVCNERVRRLEVGGIDLKDVSDLFPDLGEEEEANLLNARGNRFTECSNEIASVICPEDASMFDGLPLLERYFIWFWAKSHGIALREAWEDFKAARNTWATRYENYKHALLFTSRPGKRGIRKYYTGWNVFLHLSAINVRYLLQLVDQSLLLHLQAGKDLATPVSPEDQTKAAQGVGQKNLAELEGLTVHGAQLTKLLLGLGRIFQLLASDPGGHAPEITEFHLSEAPAADDSFDKEAEKLLNSAVMHLALLRFSGSKLAESDTRDYDYMVHPIFSAFFVFSYRKKRRMILSSEQLLGLLREPKRVIAEILAAHNRVTDEPLPDQLLLFEGYYGAA